MITIFHQSFSCANTVLTESFTDNDIDKMPLMNFPLCDIHILVEGMVQRYD